MSKKSPVCIARKFTTTYALFLQDSRQHRENVRRSLSRASLGLAKDIFSVQCKRNGFALDECWLEKLLFGDGLDEARVQSKVGKGELCICR